MLDVFLFGARRMEFIGQRMLDGVQAAQLYEQARQTPADMPKLAQVERLIRKNRDAYARLGQQFAALWLSESKPYALDWTLGRYTNAVNECEALLGKLETARQAAASSGQPLPAADELGLAAPKPLFRRVRPAESSPEALAPELPWADPSATHRLGLLVRAGAVDRFDLPLEVELTLPADLPAKPVRAFLIGTNAAPREILAQLDRLDSSGKARLVLMLPGLLPHGTEAPVQVYLGLAQAPAPLPTAVHTTDGPNGMRWIENDQVRLLLGPEGAHVYRWELKAAGNRDLTMPGESDWHGFSDQHPHRGATYQLTCNARGPAMVEYECNDPVGPHQSHPPLWRGQLDRGPAERAGFSLLGLRQPEELRRRRADSRPVALLRRSIRSGGPRSRRRVRAGQGRQRLLGHQAQPGPIGVGVGYPGGPRPVRYCSRRRRGRCGN